MHLKRFRPLLLLVVIFCFKRCIFCALSAENSFALCDNKSKASILSPINSNCVYIQLSPFNDEKIQAIIAINKNKEFSLICISNVFVVEKARTGRNPQTGKPIDIPAKGRVKFKAGADLAGAVN